ncbi:glycosyltransferase [Planctomicrobium sp. SH664]|uniref:glycosyltransferase n=1 Tax=Planctomicrobium sp. SH664 TaxID=3448125 RepID=UPI003F5C1F0A
MGGRSPVAIGTAMKILFLSTTFPDAAAPSRGTYNAALCRALARDHQVRVIAPRMFTEVYRPLRPRKQFTVPADIAAAGIAVDYPTYWYTPKLLQHCYGEQMWWSVRSVVEEAMQSFQPDAVLSYWAHPEGEVGVRAAQLQGIPSAVIVGGTDVLVLPKLPRRGERVQDVLLQSHAVITVSEGLRTAVTGLGIHPERVRTIYQGIDDSIFHQRLSREEARRRLDLSDDFAHLVWVGRIVAIKALDMLLDAVALLRDWGVHFKLHLIGDGPLRGSLTQQAARRGMDSFVHFHGAMSPQQTADWYRAADLTVLSSDSEGLPNVLRESLACGTPFVSTDVGSLGEIAGPGFSLLVPPRDAPAMAHAIQSMLTTEAKTAAATYRPRHWNETAAQTAALLQSLSRQHPQRVTRSESPTKETSDLLEAR